MAQPIKNCTNCGAPVATPPVGTSEIACQYCGHLVRFDWTKHAPRSAASGMSPLVPILLVVGGLVAAGIASSVLIAARVHSAGVALAEGAGIALGSNENFPISCGMNQEVSLVGRKFEGTGTLITGDINCKIKIKDCTLKGDIVVLAKNLVEVTVENSTLEGKQTAVKLEMNSKLDAKKQTHLKAEEAGLEGGINSQVSLEDSSVEGGEVGIKADTNFKLRATKSGISGKEYGIRASNNLELEGKELTLTGSRAALDGEVNLKLELRGGAFEGGETALHMSGPNASIKLSRAARLSAKESALKTASNLELEMEDALIDGGEIGIETDVNPKLTLGPKARIHGKQIALKAGLNLELQMRSATLESESVAVCAPFNVEVNARESVIRGGRDAFRFQRRPDELSLTSTTVTGNQQFNARGCNP
ncbi:MAG TPA: hypothetical protein VG937_00825 [Polyangiaceae bacterium]|nr:hypothetical protein [Polyangiaceae bacterium]